MVVDISCCLHPGCPTLHRDAAGGVQTCWLESSEVFKSLEKSEKTKTQKQFEMHFKIKVRYLPFYHTHLLFVFIIGVWRLKLFTNVSRKEPGLMS